LLDLDQRSNDLLKPVARKFLPTRITCLHGMSRCQLRVNNGPNSAQTGLPKCPREQTFTVLVGMSRTCQKRINRITWEAAAPSSQLDTVILHGIVSQFQQAVVYAMHINQ
jgi:hypothetical protein